MYVALAVSGSALAMALAVVARAFFVYLDGYQRRMEEERHKSLQLTGFASQEDFEALQKTCRQLAEDVDALPRKWEEIRNEARRFDGRARYALGRAKAFAEESGFDSAQLDALLQEAGLSNGSGSEPEGVQPVHESVGGPPQQQPPEHWRTTINRMKAEG